MENELHQRAGNYLVSKYSSYDMVPDKYKYFYNIYIPMKSGTKRKKSLFDYKFKYFIF